MCSSVLHDENVNVYGSGTVLQTPHTPLARRVWRLRAREARDTVTERVRYTQPLLVAPLRIWLYVHMQSVQHPRYILDLGARSLRKSRIAIQSGANRALSSSTHGSSSCRMPHITSALTRSAPSPNPQLLPTGAVRPAYRGLIGPQVKSSHLTWPHRPPAGRCRRLALFYYELASPSDAAPLSFLRARPVSHDPRRRFAIVRRRPLLSFGPCCHMARLPATLWAASSAAPHIVGATTREALSTWHCTCMSSLRSADDFEEEPEGLAS